MFKEGVVRVSAAFEIESDNDVKLKFDMKWCPSKPSLRDAWAFRGSVIIPLEFNRSTSCVLAVENATTKDIPPRILLNLDSPVCTSAPQVSPDLREVDNQPPRQEESAQNANPSPHAQSSTSFNSSEISDYNTNYEAPPPTVSIPPHLRISNLEKTRYPGGDQPPGQQPVPLGQWISDHEARQSGLYSESRFASIEGYVSDSEESIVYVGDNIRVQTITPARDSLVRSDR